MLAHSFLIESSSKLLVTRTGIKAWMSLILGLWFPWPIYMFFEMRFDLGTLDSGEQSLPFGLLVGQGRSSRQINGRKLIFYMRIYKSHDLYFMVHWLRTWARLSVLRFLSKVESQDLLMVAGWYFIWGCISMRPAGIYKSHDLLTFFSQSADFSRLWTLFQSWYFCHR